MSDRELSILADVYYILIQRHIDYARTRSRWQGKAQKKAGRRRTRQQETVRGRRKNRRPGASGRMMLWVSWYAQCDWMDVKYSNCDWMDVKYSSYDQTDVKQLWSRFALIQGERRIEELTAHITKNVIDDQFVSTYSPSNQFRIERNDSKIAHRSAVSRRHRSHHIWLISRHNLLSFFQIMHIYMKYSTVKCNIKTGRDKIASMRSGCPCSVSTKQQVSSHRLHSDDASGGSVRVARWPRRALPVRIRLAFHHRAQSHGTGLLAASLRKVLPDHLHLQHRVDQLHQRLHGEQERHVAEQLTTQIVNASPICTAVCVTLPPYEYRLRGQKRRGLSCVSGVEALQ